jgi:drug/metabolite transporter (DMT)-like permease
VLLTGNGISNISLSYGQTLTLICAFVIALEIILIGYFAGKVNLRRVTVIQLAVASFLSFASMPLVGEHNIPSFSWQLSILVISLGLASALIQFVMNWAQRMVDPTRAAIIYAGEPVWAGLFGRIAGERLPLLALLGGLMVVLGVLVSELKWNKPKQKER